MFQSITNRNKATHNKAQCYVFIMHCTSVVAISVCSLKLQVTGVPPDVIINPVLLLALKESLGFFMFHKRAWQVHFEYVHFLYQGSVYSTFDLYDQLVAIQSFL